MAVELIIMKRFPMDAVDLWFIVISLIRLYGLSIKNWVTNYVAWTIKILDKKTIDFNGSRSTSNA